MVRWKGQVGFLIRDAGEDFSARLRYAPLIEGQWAHGCAITLDVPILYRPRKIFVVSDGVPSRATLETALPKIAGLAIHSREGNFAFSDDGTAPRPIRTTITFSSREKIVLPLFGADDPEAAALQISGPDQWGTARLGGHSYLLRVNGAYGAAAKWPLTTIIFYDFSEGKTVVTGGDAPDPPLASAVVEIAPGSPAMSVSKGE
ncbi:MAG TPA: hypothetical protein VG501_11450 [Rhizomicrobium sp.]|nr:hypothetical protein [Rhizomicrobium sp.]